MAILFSRSASSDDSQTVRLNHWLRLQPRTEGLALADQSARILMELRKSIDRFVAMSWRELNISRLPPTNQLPPSATWRPPAQLHGRLGEVVVSSVVRMLDEDHEFWANYRATRRTEIDAEMARIAKQREALKGMGDGLQELIHSADSVADPGITLDRKDACTLANGIEDELNQNTASATT